MENFTDTIYGWTPMDAEMPAQAGLDLSEARKEIIDGD